MIKVRKIKNNISFKNIFKNFLVTFLIITLFVFIKYYIKYVNDSSNKILNNIDINYISYNSKNEASSFKNVDIYNELEKYIKTNKSEIIVYKLEEKNIFFNIKVNKNEKSFDIRKITYADKNIYAKIDIKNIQEISYLENSDESVLILKFVSEYNKKYLVFYKNEYYFLGADIDEIEINNDNFYYYKYNTRYMQLKNINKCTKKIISNIYDYNKKDVFYTKGEIHFFESYYQKTNETKKSVKDYCNSLKK